MLTHPTPDQPNTLVLYGMAKAFSELDKHGDSATLNHAEWLGLLLDREMTHRYDKRLIARFASPGCVTRPRQKMSTIAMRAAWIDTSS